MKAGRRMIITPVIRSLKMQVSDTIISSYLRLLKPEHKLWLAISETAFDEIFSIEGIEVALEQNKMPVIIVRTETEELVKWKSYNVIEV